MGGKRRERIRTRLGLEPEVHNMKTEYSIAIATGSGYEPLLCSRNIKSTRISNLKYLQNGGIL